MDQNEANYKNWFLSEHDPEDNLVNIPRINPWAFKPD